jgi:transposase-like protein
MTANKGRRQRGHSRQVNGTSAAAHRGRTQARRHRTRPLLGSGTTGRAVVRLWENAWNEFSQFLDYDVEIRKVICSTNAIESLNTRYRRAVNAFAITFGDRFPAAETY